VLFLECRGSVAGTVHTLFVSKWLALTISDSIRKMAGENKGTELYLKGFGL
jgi:hypothetical protein